jgi:hemicentin
MKAIINILLCLLIYVFSLGPAMRKIISILNPIYWTIAKETREAVNGFTLTNAVFKRETKVEFATG